MRIHPWLAALSSACLLIAAGETPARAQQTSQAVFESGGFGEALEGRVRLTSASGGERPAPVRAQSPGAPPFQAAYQTQNPAALWPPQAPPSTFHPYPQISPYYPPNVATTSTFNRDGLWFKELLFRDRDYFLTLEYLMVRYRNPGNEVVGARPANFFRVNPSGITAGGGQGGGGAGAVVVGNVTGVFIDNHGLGGPAEFGFGTGGLFQRVAVGPGVFPYPFVFEAPAQVARTAVLDETMFPIRSLGHFDNPFKADGMRARWGYNNEDGSGMMLTGWFGTEAHDRFQFGHDAFNGVPVTQAFILANSPTGGSAFVFPRNGSLPLLVRDDFLNSGADPLTDLVTLGYTGISQKFDILFQYDVRTFAAGGALHLYHEPLFKRDWISVRPTYGARYQYLDERFNFRGIDSGFGYTLDFGDGGGGAGAGQGISTFRPTADAIFPVIDDVGNGFFFEANLESQAWSHMAGPEIGLRYDFGTGRNFSVWGQSTVALLANYEKVQLMGKNIGDPVNYWLVTGDNWADPTDGIDTRFQRNEKHTHASPMFEQSVFIDMAVFRYVPVLKDMHVLENARFRTGYTYTVIGEVMRPAENIVWRSFPDLPTISSHNRHTWSTHNWSFAVDWEF